MSHIAEHNYHAKQGDTFLTVFTRTDENGSAIDMTGYDVEFAFARSPGSTPSFQYTTADYVDMTEAASGTVTIEVPPAETANWEHRRYLYEVTITDTSGRRTTLYQGRLDVDLDRVT